MSLIHLHTLISNRDHVSKSIDFKDGRLVKTQGHGVYYAIARKIGTRGVREFADVVQDCTTRQCHMYGGFPADAAGIVSQRVLARMQFDSGYARSVAADFEGLPILTRTREHVIWMQAPSWLMIDVDYDLTDNEVHAILDHMFPALVDAPHLVVSSASSYIYDTATGSELKGKGGSHLYFPITSGLDVPEAMEVLYRSAIACGEARYKWTANGSIRKSTIIDSAMRSPLQIDYVAGALCGRGLEQRRPAPKTYNPDRPAIDLRTTIINAETEADLARFAEADAAAVERLWSNPPENARREQAARPARTKIERETPAQPAPRTQPAAKGKTLRGPEMLDIPGVGRVSWRDVAHDPGRYHNVRCIDPFEDGTREAVIFAQDGPMGIYGYSHGGTWHSSVPIRFLSRPKDRPAEEESLPGQQ
jgi:hypothetical protein